MTNSSTITQPTPPEPSARRGNGFGTTALIIGIIAFILGLIPFVGYGSWLLALLAIIFGIIAVTRKGRPKVLGAVGLVLGIVALVLGFVISISATAAVVASVNDENNKVTSHSVVYSATADSKTVSVTYETYQNDKSVSIDKDFSAPFTKTIKYTNKGDFNFNTFSVTAQSKSDKNSATASCKITVDGKTKATDSAKGPFATATCSATD